MLFWILVLLGLCLFLPLQDSSLAKLEFNHICQATEHFCASNLSHEFMEHDGGGRIFLINQTWHSFVNLIHQNRMCLQIKPVVVN